MVCDVEVVVVVEVVARDVVRVVTVGVPRLVVYEVVVGVP